MMTMTMIQMTTPTTQPTIMPVILEDDESLLLSLAFVVVTIIVEVEDITRLDAKIVCMSSVDMDRAGTTSVKTVDIDNDTVVEATGVEVVAITGVAEVVVITGIEVVVITGVAVVAITGVEVVVKTGVEVVGTIDVVVGNALGAK